MPIWHRSAFALIALGATGILVFIPISWAEFRELSSPPLPPFLLALLSAVQPTILLVAGAFAGSFAAPRLGLRSLVAERLTGRIPTAGDLGAIPRLVLFGTAVGFAINAVDELARPLWVPDGAEWPSYPDAWSPATLVFGLLYGGITEEVVFRWGLMSLLACALLRLTGRRSTVPNWVWAAAVAVSSILFAAGHLPALAALIPLSPGPVIRTLVLNGAVGLWFGWLFLRHHLEATMAAHAALHVGFAVYAVTLIGLG